MHDNWLHEKPNSIHLRDILYVEIPASQKCGLEWYWTALFLSL